MERLSMSVNDLGTIMPVAAGGGGGGVGGGLGSSLQRLNLSSGDLDDIPELDCLQTVAELSIESFQVAPIPNAEDLTMGIDINRGERKKKKKKKEKKDKADETTTTGSSSALSSSSTKTKTKEKQQQRRRQSTGGLGKLESQLSQMFLENQIKNTYDAVASADDLRTVADVSIASFHPVEFEEDKENIEFLM